jgi:spore maturation protein SpmB
MAQSIVLKRSALSGKVPDTSSLSLGEIAINTYDGRVFFKKSGSLESVQHIVTTDSITTGSIILTGTGSFGELLVTQDANFQRDIFVTRDIVSNGDIDILGSFTASLANGYVWVGNGQNKTTLVATSSFGGSAAADVQLLISKTGSYATTGSNTFVGNQTISGSLILTSSLTLNDSSNQILVRNTGSGIIEYASITSLLDTKNLITVGASGSKGVDFNSIKAAVNSITDASEYNTYTVRVGPGIFYETEITMKSWITVKGDSTTTTIVSASNASASIFVGADQSMVIDMQIQGTTAPSQSAIVYSSPTTPQTNAIFYVENVRFGTNYTHAKVIGTSGGNCIMQCSNVKYGGWPFTLGFHVTNDGSGIGRMQLRNVTSTNGGVATSTGLIFAKADQPGCAFIVNGCLLTKAVGAAAGTGFWVENGGSLRLTAVNFQRWERGIYAPNVGSAPSIFGSALNFENNTYDVYVEHTSATGHIEGTDAFLKTIIPAAAPLYEIDTDPRKLIVAKKGGDFTSISASVAWIVDSSETNRYIIEVGPGEFTENVIDLRNKPYISIVGSDIRATQIIPAGNHNQFILGNANEVSFLSLIGNNTSGYAAFVAEDLDGFALIHKISIYDWDTGIKLVGNTLSSQFFGEYVDINGPFTYGTYISASNGTNTNISMENYYLFPSGGVSTGNYAIGAGAELDLYTAVFAGDSVSGSSAIYLVDGAVSEVAGLDVQNWEYGVYVPNIGTAPRFRIVGGMIHNSLTYDFNILKTGTQGRFQGISDHTKINNSSQEFYWNFLDDTDGENDITRKLSVTFADGTHTDASTLIFKGSPMGLINGGNITVSTGLTASVASGFGYLADFSDPDIIKRIDWNTSTINLTPNSNNYIYFNDNAILSSAGSEPAIDSNIVLGRVVTNNTDIEFIDDSPYVATHMASCLSLFNRAALGPVYQDGSIVTENVTPFKLDITPGTYFYSENKYTPSSGSQISFIRYYQSASVYNREVTTTTVPSGLYNSGSELIPMSASYYTKHSLYLVGQDVNEKYFLVVGQDQFATLVETEDATLPTPPSYFNDGVVPVASIYVQSGSANITQIQDIRPVIGFRAAGVNASSVHGNLLGLEQDDHTQYVLANGNRSMTGNFNLGGNSIINAGSVTATTINGAINATNGVVSGSSQIISILNPLNNFTSSVDTKFGTLSNVTSSLNQFTSSANSRLSSLESFTSSLDTTFVNQTELATATGSLINSIATKLNTSSFNSYTSSNDSRVSSLENFTASLDVTYVNQTELATATGSLINSIATKLNTSSFETYTGSIDTKFTTLANVTASLINATSSYETKGRGIVSGSSQITPLLPVGTVSGSSQVVGILSSLNSYTASNDTTNTTQNSRLSSLENFTSSLDVTYVNQTELASATGSLINSIATKLNTSSFQTYTGSIDTKFTTLANVTASLNASTASQQNSIDLLGLFSSSQNTKNSTLATYTSSIDTKFTTLATYTGSIETKNSTLATYTGSVDTKFTTLSNITSSLNTFTSSANSRLNNLESFTASLDTTYVNQTELANATGSLINSIATKLNTSSFETYTGSIDTKFTSLQNSTASLNASTASQQNSIDLLNVFSSSENTKNSTLASYTSSIDTKFTTLANVTSSLNASTASQQNSIDLLGAFSASENTKNSTLATYTGSVDTKFTTLANVTASLNQFTSSANSRLNSLESFTSSLDATYVNQTELANATGSLINSIATKLNTSSFETYTGSVETKFTTLSNITSSLNQSTASQQNSIDLLGAFTSSENTKNSTLATYTGSVDTKFTTLQNVTASLQLTTASLQNSVSVINSFTSSTNSRLSSIESFTGSLDATYVNQTELATATGSLINSIATKLNTSSFETYTGSIDNKFTNLSNTTASLNASTASQQNSIDLLNAFSSSENTKNSTLATYTGSVDTKFTTLATYTSSVDTKFTTLANITASLNASTASQQNSIDLLGAFTSSENTKNSTLATYTGSVDTKFTTLATYTSSIDTKFTTLTNVTSSLNTFTSSTNSRLNSLESFTASIDNTFVNNTELANATGSLINSIATKLDTSSFQTYTGSVDTKFTTLSNLTSSLNSSTASQQNSIDLLGAFSASENTKNSTLATYTGSVDTKFTTLGTYTGSVDTKFSTLQTTTASIQNSITLINTFTSSVDTKFTTLANVTSSLISKTGSYATTGSNTFNGNQIISGSAYFHKTSTDYISLLDEANTITFAPGAPSNIKYGTTTILAMKAGGGNSTILYGAGAAILSATQFGVKIQQSADGAYANSMLYVKGSGSAATSTAVKVENSSGNPSMIIFDNNTIAINKTSANGTLDISGSAIITGSLIVTQGITGSLFGTASNAISSSFPITVTGTALRSVSPAAGTNGTHSIYFGNNAGANANASDSNFLGFEAGGFSSNVNNSNFLGRNAGVEVFSASFSNFLGSAAGYTAGTVNYSNFLGAAAGYSAQNANHSNFLGQNAGRATTSASYSTLIGYQAGYNVVGGAIGIKSNNIIIGTNITLNSGRQDSINLGGLIFGTGSYSTIAGNPFSGSANGQVGINQPNPQFNFDVSGSGRYTNGLTVTGSFDLANAEFNATASNSSAGNVLVSTNPTASYVSAFYNYSITSGTNARAGQIMSIWNGNTLRYTEVTTTDIGNTSTAVFSASISAGNVLLHLSSSGVWNVRSIVNLL